MSFKSSHLAELFKQKFTGKNACKLDFNPVSKKTSEIQLIFNRILDIHPSSSTSDSVLH